MSSRRSVVVAAVVLACACGGGRVEGEAVTPSSSGESSGGSSGARGGSSGAASSGAGSSGSSSGGSSSGPSGSSSGGGSSSGSGSSSSSSGSSSSGSGMGCTGAALCDDFESAPAGGAPSATLWTLSTPNCSGTGRVVIDGTQAHSGTRSARVDGGGGYCNHVFMASSAVAGIGSVVHGRFFVRVAAALDASHVTFLAMRDGADGGRDLRMGGQSGILMWNRESDDATLPALSPAGIALSRPLEVNRWTCVEFRVDQAAGTMETWVDGVSVPALVEDGASTPDVDEQWLRKAGWRPSLTDFRLGWESYGGTTLQLWFDDVVLSTRRIGCG